MLKTIFSGGETGADWGGIQFARYGYNLEGWMAAEWMTEEGPKPEYAGYGLREHPSLGTAAKSEANVRDSDGTIVFARDFDSPGTACVLRAIQKYGKPHLKIDVSDWMDISVGKDWLLNNNIQVLNIAGNRDSVSPGIALTVVRYMTEVTGVMNDPV